MKCKHCGIELPEDFRKHEHIKRCKNASKSERHYLNCIISKEEVDAFRDKGDEYHNNLWK